MLNAVYDYSTLTSYYTTSSYRVDRIGMQFDDCTPSYVVSRVFSANLPIQLDAEQKSNFENCMSMRSSAVIRGRDVRSRFFETPAPILHQNYRMLLQSCSNLRQKSKLQLLFSLLLLEEFLQTLQSQCYPNFRPMLNFMQVRLLVFRDCARTDASQRA